jgi:hypothetical protein
MQQAGGAGIYYKPKFGGPDTVHFDGPAGDQNSGGLLRIDGDGLGSQSSVVITALKNEFGTNTYREPRNVGTNPSYPQSPNALVLYNAHGINVSIRGMKHWAAGTSSVGANPPYQEGNAWGRDIGAAILVIPSLSVVAPDVTWEALRAYPANLSGQTVTYALRDKASTTILPIVADYQGKGTNRPKPPAFRAVADANATVSVHDATVAWSTLTAPRTAALPAISRVPVGTVVRLADSSGSATAAFTITAVPSGTDTILGTKVIDSAYGQLSLTSNGTAWIASYLPGSGLVTLTGTQTLTNKTIGSPKMNQILDTNGGVVVNFTATAVADEAEIAITEDIPEADGKIASNYIELAGGATGVGPTVRAAGADANLQLYLVPKGTSPVTLYSSANTPAIAAQGPGTDLSLDLRPKGFGSVTVNSNPVGVKVTGPTIGTAYTNPGLPGQFSANGTTGLVSFYTGNGTTHSWTRPAVVGEQAATGSPLQLWTGTKTQYDQIVTKSATTIYVVTAATAVTGDITVDEGAETGDITAAAPATKSTRKK